MILNILLTKRCNLECNYCYLDKGNNQNKEITKEILNKAIAIFLKLPSKKKTLNFSGGEPLLRFGTIKEIIEPLRQFKNTANLNYSLVSNGTLLNKSHFDFFKENGIVCKISLDGVKKAHDRQRPFKSKKGGSSYERIIKNIKTIHKEDSVGISMVFTPQAAGSLLTNIKSLWENGFHDIDFFPQNNKQWSKNDLRKIESSFKKVKKFIILTFKKATTEKDIFRNSFLQYLAQKDSSKKNILCDRIHLGWDGQFYCCGKVFSLPEQERKQYGIGNVKDGIDNTRRLSLLRQGEREIKNLTGVECQKCRYANYCFCRIGSFIYFSSRTGDFKKYFFQHCYISKIYIQTFLQIIKELKKNSLFQETYGII